MVTVKELTERFWYAQEIEIVEKEYSIEKENRILWTGENYKLRDADLETVKVRNMLVKSDGIVDNKLIIVV